MINTIATLMPVLGQRGARRHLGVPRHLTRRRKSGRPRPPAHRAAEYSRAAFAQKRALTAEERRAVLELLGGEAFADVIACQVVELPRSAQTPPFRRTYKVVLAAI